MDSPLPFYFESDKGQHKGIVPTCHSLDFLTREFLPLLDWEAKHNHIESYSLAWLTMGSDRPVYDITFRLADAFSNRMRMTVVGVDANNFCPIFLRVFNNRSLAWMDTIPYELGSATIVATEWQYSGRARHWDVRYWLFGEDGSVTEWSPDSAIAEAVSGLAPEGCRWEVGNGLDLRALRWRKVYYCGEDRFNVESSGTVEVDFRFEDNGLVPTRRARVPHARGAKGSKRSTTSSGALPHDAHLPPEAVAVESPYPFTYTDDGVGQIETIVPTCHSLDSLTRELLPIGDLKWNISQGATIAAHRLAQVTTTSLGTVYDLFLELDGSSYYDEVKLIIVPFGDDYCPVYLNMVNRVHYPGPNDSFAVEGTAATIVASEMGISGSGGFVEAVHFRIEGSNVKRLDFGILLGHPIELPAVVTSERALDWYFSDRGSPSSTRRQDPPSSTSGP